VWLIAGGVLALLAGNPLYLALLLLISRLVQYACASTETNGWRIPFWRISLVILFFSTLFNAFTAHVGQTVLFSLPAHWVLVGGPITIEAAIYGFLNGLRLVTLLSFFMAFNAIVPVGQMTGLAPGALHELGLVVLIAFTYVPETIRQFHRIRDAQAVRGHRLNGIRAWRPILIPLIITGLERSLNLAETMVARGYGSTDLVAVFPRARLVLVGGLLLVLVGALQSAWARSGGGLYLIAGGAIAIAWAYWDLSRHHIRTKYRPRKWTHKDSLLVVGALLPFMILVLPAFDRAALTYLPYPRIGPPVFDLWIGLSLMGIVFPVVLTEVTIAIKGTRS
jgi:energy-coupling factor transport system permease protein